MDPSLKMSLAKPWTAETDQRLQKTLKLGLAHHGALVARASHHPQEALPAQLQPEHELAHLRQPPEPKMTDLGGCRSSHSMHAAHGSSVAPSLVLSKEFSNF
jgi:hypothetical protein